MVNYIKCKGCAKTIVFGVPDDAYWSWQDGDPSKLTKEQADLLIRNKCKDCK